HEVSQKFSTRRLPPNAPGFMRLPLSVVMEKSGARSPSFGTRPVCAPANPQTNTSVGLMNRMVTEVIICTSLVGSTIQGYDGLPFLFLPGTSLPFAGHTRYWYRVWYLKASCKRPARSPS